MNSLKTFKIFSHEWKKYSQVIEYFFPVAWMTEVNIWVQNVQLWIARSIGQMKNSTN